MSKIGYIRVSTEHHRHLPENGVTLVSHKENINTDSTIFSQYRPSESGTKPIGVFQRFVNRAFR